MLPSPPRVEPGRLHQIYWFRLRRLRIPGIIAAQRFKLSDVQRNPSLPWRYLALYEIETDDLNQTVTALKERAGTSAMVLSDAVAESIGWFFRPITPKVEAGGS